MIRALFRLAFVAVVFWPSISAPVPTDAATSSGASDTETEAPLPTYWLRNREGWFWYQDPALEVRKKQASKQERHPKELVEFEAMQKRLDELKRIAVMNPSESHMKAYMGYQRYVMNKSALFADNWQRLVWKTPELDYSLAGRPTNSFAIDVFDGQLRDQQAKTIRALAKTHGLFFFFRSDCPYCHKFAPVLKRFEQEFGLTVFAVSLDGGGLPEYPTPLTDNGMATNLKVSVVPAIFLAVPGTREITPIGYGVMAETDIVERIHAITQTKPGRPF